MTDNQPATQGRVSQNKKWYERTRYQVLLFVGGIVLFFLVGGLTLDWYINPRTSGQKKDLVQALGLLTAGVAGAVGIYFTWRGQRQAREAQEENQRNTLQQLEQSRNELEINREGQITDRFTNAIDQLGKTDEENPPNPIEEIRLGGIYALEQIALDAPDKYHWPIMQVFAAYLRRYAPWQDDPSKVNLGSADIQTVLDVIGRRSRHFGMGEDEPLLLGRLDLSNYSFPENAHLEHALLDNTHFETSGLSGVHLRNAYLKGAHLQGAYVDGADLSEADLRGAHLEGTHLWDADLTGANLSDAYLTATILSGATLSEETKLKRESLEEANGDWSTKLGEIPRPIWWGNLPGDDAILEPAEYSIKLWKILLHFHALGTGWYSSLALPYNLTLSPAGVTFAGLAINFCTGPWVCVPQKPKEVFALEKAPKDIATWFWKHPHLTPTTQPQDWENKSGGTAGKQFSVEVTANDPEKELDMSSAEGPRVPLIPTNPRAGNLGFVMGKKNRVIVVEDEDEWMLITIQGPASEFDTFNDRVDEEVLADLYCGKKAYEHLASG
jgi:uncharacterized protein YjbI with pentapeptide repeats